MFLPDLDPAGSAIEFFKHGSKGQKSTGSRIRIRNNDMMNVSNSVADPDPGLGAFLTPGSVMGESLHPDLGENT